MLEQIDKIMRYGLPILALSFTVRIMFVQLSQKYSHQTIGWLLASAFAVTLFVVMPPVLVLIVTIILTSDPENWFELLFPVVLMVLCSIVTYKAANKFFLR